MLPPFHCQSSEWQGDGSVEKLLQHGCLLADYEPDPMSDLFLLLSRALRDAASGFD
jgi:hypothetical protein